MKEGGRHGAIDALWSVLLAFGTTACNRGDRTARTDAAIAAEVRHDLAQKQVPAPAPIAPAPNAAPDMR
jgi:hypothetical protein